MKLQLSIFLFVVTGLILGSSEKLHSQITLIRKKAEGTIIFNDGTSLDCLIYDFKAQAKKIKVKTKEGKTKRYKADEIKSIIYHKKDGELKLERHQCAAFLFNKVRKNAKLWLTEFYSSGGVKGYYHLSEVKMGGGFMSGGYYRSTSFHRSAIMYYVQTKNDKYPVQIATKMKQGKLINSTWDRNMRNNFSRLVKKQCPKFKKFAKKKKYKISNIDEMLDAYVEMCGEK